MIVALAAGTARAEPPRTHVLADLSASRAAGIETSVGGLSRSYSNLWVARVDVFGDIALGSHAKVFARLPLGYEAREIDEGDDLSGFWSGNLVMGGRWVALRGARDRGFDAAASGTLILPIGTARESDVGDGSAAYHLPHAPRYIDPRFGAFELGADGRYRRGDAFGQLGLAVQTVLDHGPQLDIVRAGVGGGFRVAQSWCVVLEVSPIWLPPDGTSEIGFDAAVEWRRGDKSVALQYYRSTIAGEGDYGTVGAAGVMTF